MSSYQSRGRADRAQLDHYIIYHCHYELGRLYAQRGSFAEAKKNFDVIMSGTSARDHETRS